MATYHILASIIFILELGFISLFIYLNKQYKLSISKTTSYWFIPVFIFALLAYLLGYFYVVDQVSLLGILHNLVFALKTFTFEIKDTYIKQLLTDSIWFSFAFYLAYALAIFTVIQTAMLLFKNRIINFFRANQILKTSCDIVVGYSKTGLIYLEKHKKNAVLLLTDFIHQDEVKYLYEHKIRFIKGNIVSFLNDKKRLKENTKYNFIAFETHETRYQDLINAFVQIHDEKCIYFLFLEVKYHEIEVVRNEYLKHRMTENEKNLNVFIRTFSRYEMIARKFVNDITLPSLLPTDFFNKNKTIKEHKKINVFFYGFGKMNTSLFAMFCQNNQLVGMKDSRLIAKEVNYYAIDKNDDAKDAKRMDYALKHMRDMKSDMPLPEMPCQFHAMHSHVNRYDTIEEVRSIVNQPEAFSLFVISYGTDFENAETALWLKNEFEASKIKIACRLKDNRIESEDIIYFGNEAEIIDQRYIVLEELQKLALDIHMSYQKNQSQRKLDLERKWDTLAQVELYSNYYAAMNLKFKLHLLGLDISKERQADAVTLEAFMAIYDEGKKHQEGYERYFDTAIRNVIAYSEKLRWNAFYIFNGYQPMLLNDIEYQKNKVIWRNHTKKQHACLTSHAGLDQLHRHVVNELIKRYYLDETNTNEIYEKLLKQIETYQYDYMAFDDPQKNLILSLYELGYTIYKK